MSIFLIARKHQRQTASLAIGAIAITALLAACTPPAAPSDATLRSIFLESDDFERHGDAFVAAGQDLIRRRVCTLADLRKGEIWMRSQNRGKNVYFINWTGHVRTRWYVDVRSGRVFQ